jgi:hypothetical protein
LARAGSIPASGTSYIQVSKPRLNALGPMFLLFGVISVPFRVHPVSLSASPTRLAAR